MNLVEYVTNHTIRGACTCGKCIDAPDNPEKEQPQGHTVDLTFFKVATQNEPNADEFRDLVEAEFPHWLDGEEHNYLNCGSDIGDQGLAMMAFGLGHLLGVWKVLCPETMMSFLPHELKMQMAEKGMISIKAA